MSIIEQGVRKPARAGSLRVGAFRQDAAHIRALERVKAWTRECLQLGDDDTISVSEVACSLPGCPPLETVVTFWIDGDKRHWFKVFKPAAEVIADNLPPAWLKDSLYATDPIDGACC